MTNLAQVRWPSLAGFQRTELAFARQVCESARLSRGEAFVNSRFPMFADVNFVADCDCGDADAVSQFRAEVNSFFAAKGSRCREWRAAAGSAIEPLDAALRQAGFVRRDLLGFARSICKLSEQADAPAMARESLQDVRILPARAMPRAYRKILEVQQQECDSAKHEARVAVAIDRLDDAQYEPLVALLGDEPVGTAALHSVGDIGAIHALFVAPPARCTGVATQLVSRIAQIAQRWCLDVLYAGVEANNPALIQFMSVHGFENIGVVPRWRKIGFREKG